MTLSCRLVAGVLLVLAFALLSSSAEERSSTGRAATAMGVARDHTLEAPVLPLRTLGLRTPVAAPPPPRSATPRGRRYRPSPPPPPPPPC
ncbi:hypothetical protein BDA96_01G210400 [Sorghum bicolor]|uniref:Uncharacterized protein n=2 Tax=Sorghum bicolor TaxID=4558 RepID=A0A921RZZ0_SORBI|nr:hypothetical protein SORBI_3001G197700 [Sorghum bicolor]KAG0548931.1 hypothetical protein BDA96_01G210400 [Sorghum bicolor]